MIENKVRKHLKNSLTYKPRVRITYSKRTTMCCCMRVTAVSQVAKFGSYRPSHKNYERHETKSYQKYKVPTI